MTWPAAEEQSDPLAIANAFFTEMYRAMFAEVSPEEHWFVVPSTVEGFVTLRNFNQVQLQIAPAHPMLPRIDRIVLAVQDNWITLFDHPGNPSVCPVAPTVLSTTLSRPCIKLADIHIPPGCHIITNDMIRNVGEWE